MHSRMLRHRFVTGAVTLTLAVGGVALTGGSANAADSADRAVSAQCQQAKKDLSAAKKKLRAAKRTDKAGKIRKAQAKVQAAKQRKAAACAPATEQSVLEQVQQGQLALDGLDTAQLTALLPPQVAAVLGQAIAQLQSGLESVAAQVPGADSAKLEALLAAVQAMDPQGVVAALQDLASTLTANGASPASINTLVQLLQGTLPGGGAVPIGGIPDLQSMLGQLTAGLPALGGVDFTDATQVQAAIGQVKAGLAAITANVKGPSAGWLGALSEMVDQLGGLGFLTPGAAGSGDQLRGLLNTLLSLVQPGVDPLAQLNQILSGGSLAGILDLLGIPLGGILG